MIRWKPKAIPSVMLPGSLAAMVLSMVLYVPAPSAMALTSVPEQTVAPVRGEDWPVLENPDGVEIMIVGLRKRHAHRPA